MANVYIKMIYILLLATILEANEINVDSTNFCTKSSNLTHPFFSHPGRDILCINFTINHDTIVDFNNYISVQLIDVKGLLTTSLRFSPILKYLYIFRSKIHDLSLELPKGVHLHVAETYFYSPIRFESFKKSSEIYTLGFHSNKALTFEDNCFQNLKRLRTLILYNQHVSIRRKLFAGLQNLTTLIINKNYIDAAEENLFDELPSLETLNLDYNKMEFVKINFGSLSNLHTLSLIGNNFKEFYLPVFKPVRSLEILRFSFKTLTTLNLSELALAFPSLNVIYWLEEEETISISVLDRIKFSGLKVYKLDKPIEGTVFDLSTLV